MQVLPNLCLMVVCLILAGCGSGYEPREEEGIAGSGQVATPEQVVTLEPARRTLSADELRKVAGEADDTVDLCAGLPTDTDRRKIAPVAKPPYLKPYKDPAFGARVMRITDSAPDEVHKPAYSTMQAWNADETLLMLYQSGGSDSGHVLLDGHTYKPVKSLNIVPADIEEVFWSHNDPDTFFYVSKYGRDYGQFKRYNVRTDKSTMVKDFSPVCGKGLPSGGGDVQMQSLDDDLFGFRCQTDKDEWVMMSYRISTDTLATAPLGGNTGYEEWSAPMSTASGEHMYQQGKIIPPTLDSVELELDAYKFSEHQNLGVGHDGVDTLFTVGFDPSPDDCNEDMWRGVGHLIAHDLETGECRNVVGEADGYPYTTSGTHISAQAWKRPGWVAMSSIGYDSFEYFSNDRKAPALLSEIYLVNTDPTNKKVCRLAQHRSFAKHAKNGTYHPYLGEPHATISPSGTRIVFGSDWYDSGSVDSYVVELPAYQVP